MEIALCERWLVIAIERRLTNFQKHYCDCIPEARCTISAVPELSAHERPSAKEAPGPASSSCVAKPIITLLPGPSSATRAKPPPPGLPSPGLCVSFGATPYSSSVPLRSGPWVPGGPCVRTHGPERDLIRNRRAHKSLHWRSPIPADHASLPIVRPVAFLAHFSTAWRDQTRLPDSSTSGTGKFSFSRAI